MIRTLIKKGFSRVKRDRILNGTKLGNQHIVKQTSKSLPRYFNVSVYKLHEGCHDKKHQHVHKEEESRPLDALHEALNLYNGEGVVKDEERAKKILHQLSEKDKTGEVFLALSFIFLSEKNFEEAIKLGEKSIEMENNLARNFLAHLFFHGGEGIEKDVKRAISLYETSVSKGNDDAMVALSLILMNGVENVVDKDLTRAVKLLEEACGMKNHEALYRYGLLLKNGIGVESNQEKAVEYLEYSSFLGNEKALEKLAFIFIEKRENEKAINCFKILADRGNKVGISFFKNKTK